ncbi:VWA domain-containing protein [Catellatospora sp. NPDC049609]|uniref:VWA domain-containing protein n=1 Tax=Catellatospora sp. NPDC049609 TaxID=3155505 RepID=UPI00341A34BE
MTVMYPSLLVYGLVLAAAAVAGYVVLQRRRASAPRAVAVGRTGWRRHLPYALFLTALTLLLSGLSRPQAELPVPRVAGTVVLVFDVSNSMAADDVAPSRLAAAQSAAEGFVKAQPDTVDIGVVMFGQGGLLTQTPTDDRDAVLDAISRLTPSGGTSLRQAILTALGAIVGEPVDLPAEDDPELPDLGYWGSATIVVFSDGQDDAPADAEAAAMLAAGAGVRIETVGIGTTQGTTVEVDGYQVATALDEQLLTALAAATGGSYHPAGDAAALNGISDAIDLRITVQRESVELTGPLAGLALLLLTLGGLLMIRWYGRIV